MYTDYFKDFDAAIIKKGSTGSKSASKKKTSSTKASSKKAPSKGGKQAISLTSLKAKLNGVVPSHLVVDAAQPIDTKGFTPEGADFIAYRKYCADIIDMMKGYVPFELIHGTYHVVDKLDKKNLNEALSSIVSVKKLNKFTDEAEDYGRQLIPSFIVAGETDYSFLELKNDILEFYVTNGIEHEYEMDILVLLNRGIVVKNWREKRSFIALETLEDTTMWFVILMNEYLEMEKEIPFDLRNYVKKDIVYKEY